MSRIVVSVALAVPGWQRVLDVELPAGATVQQALRAVQPLAEAAGLPPDSGLDWEAGAVGVFGVARVRSDALTPGDRVELYRPLQADPKESRRRRAASAGRSGGRGSR
jgi:putative ubiquitin-RnfH superfamily antitoxin RatB of RatAB toxin-antitoxin module